MKKPSTRLFTIMGLTLIAVIIGGGYVVLAKNNKPISSEEDEVTSTEISNSSTAVSESELNKAANPPSVEKPIKKDSGETNAGNLSISLDSGFLSDVRDVRVSGLTRAEFDDIKSDELYGLRTRFYLISNSGQLYDFGDGAISEDVSYNDARITFFPKNHSYSPSESYILKMELYRYTKGDPSYVLVKNVIKSVQTRVPNSQLIHSGWSL